LLASQHRSAGGCSALLKQCCFPLPVTASLFPVILGLRVEIYEQEAAFLASGVTEGDLITDLQLAPGGIGTSSVLICVQQV